MADEADGDDDIRAISALISALKPLTAESRVHVLEFVIKRLGISMNTQHTPTGHIPTHVPTEPISTIALNRPVSSGIPDIRTFAAEKNPKTVNERVAVVGYYLAQLAPENERRDYLVSDDIKTYFIQAGFELPTAPPNMTLTNAKNAGYLNAMERGQYRLNAVGHNLVVHKLPNEQSGEPKRKSARKPAKRKRSTRKKVRK